MLYGAIAASEIRPPKAPLIASALLSGSGSLSVSGSLTNPIIQGSARFAGAGALTVSGSISNPIQQGSVLFAGAGGLSANATVGGGIRIAFSQNLNNDSGDGSGYSIRSICSTLAYGGTSIRVKLCASSGVGCVFNHVSVGIQDTTYNTTATPTELLFSGSSGVTIGANAEVWSDWVSFNTTQGQTVVVIIDVATPGYMKYANAYYYYFKAATASYNESAPSGSWGSGATIHAVTEIDVQG